jgi:hypothetical protein
MVCMDYFLENVYADDVMKRDLVRLSKNSNHLYEGKW